MTETDYRSEDARVEESLEVLMHFGIMEPSQAQEWRDALARVRAEEQRDGAKVVGEGG